MNKQPATLVLGIIIGALIGITWAAFYWEKIPRKFTWELDTLIVLTVITIAVIVTCVVVARRMKR